MLQASNSLFFESVRKDIKEEPDRSRAVSRAIRDLPEDSELRRFLEAHEAEVREMCLTEYDEKEEREQLSQEFREIGKAEGRAEERTETARRMIADGLSKEKVAQYSGLSLEEVQRLAVGK